MNIIIIIYSSLGQIIWLEIQKNYINFIFLVCKKSDSFKVFFVQNCQGFLEVNKYKLKIINFFFLNDIFL